jgi:ribonuclease HII
MIDDDDMKDEYDFSNGVRGKYLPNLVLGIDEARRGPVIGPMVMAGTMMKEDGEKDLVSLGVKDSKLLSPKERQRLYTYILKMVVNHVIIIFSPAEIDAALQDPKMNLNHLEAKGTADIIEKITPTPWQVITDCPSNNTKAFIAKIRSFLKKRSEIEIVSEHKADVNYPIVSAASILAKVVGDNEIEKLKELYKIDFGSGYPSDPKTVAFLKKNITNEKYQPIFRKTWATYKELLK